jgi:hypothetical protein
LEGDYKMGTKRIKLEEGQVYAVPLPDESYTIAQLFNQHIINSRQSQVTFGFFNYKFSTLEQLKANYNELDLSKPFSIATTNGYPWHYGWEFLGSRTINTTYNYKVEIDNLGLFKERSTDPLIFLEPYFGILPWDETLEGRFVRHLLPNAEIRKDIKYIKDYTTEELINRLGKEHIRVKERLKGEVK